MELLLPGLGLIVWTTLAFLIVLFLLSKFAWKPILKSIKNREDYINQSLEKAANAEKQMKNVVIETEQILKEAQAEKNQILKEAYNIKNQIVVEAKEVAKKEAAKIIDNAKAEMLTNQNKAMEEIKKHIAKLIVLTAEKVLDEKLKTTKEQQRIIEQSISKMAI